MGGIMVPLSHFAKRRGGGIVRNVAEPLEGRVLLASPAQTPFPSEVHQIPGIIQAEDFDEGGDFVSYHDETPENEGGEYRDTGVDLERSDAPNGGYRVTDVKAAEWLEYTVNVTTAGYYILHLEMEHGTVHVEFDGLNLTARRNYFIGWYDYGVTLNAGQQTMRVYFEADSIDPDVVTLDWIKFNRAPELSNFSITPNPAYAGQNLRLNVDSVIDTDGFPTGVDFFMEGNGTDTAGFQPGDWFLGHDDPSPGWGLTIPTRGWISNTVYVFYAVPVDNEHAYGPAAAVTLVLRFADAPRLVDRDFKYDTAPHRIVYTFTKDVGSTLDTSDLILQNMTTGVTVPAADLALSYNPATRTATFTAPKYPMGVLPDGNWRATLKSAGISADGWAFDGDYDLGPGGDHSFDFFYLTGDVNGDRGVNFADLVTVAQNYNTTGKDFRHGNLSYDPGGKVDFDDLVILAQNYNAVLPRLPQAAPVVRAVTGAPSPRPAPKPRPKVFSRRTIDLLA
jgi:hypothetical protein